VIIVVVKEVKAKSRKPAILILPIVLMIFGAIVALTAFLISWLEYDRVYFFNGFLITKIAWIVAFTTIPLGFIMSLIVRNARKKWIKYLLVFLTCVLVLGGILLKSYEINKPYMKSKAPAAEPPAAEAPSDWKTSVTMGKPPAINEVKDLVIEAVYTFKKVGGFSEDELDNSVISCDSITAQERGDYAVKGKIKFLNEDGGIKEVVNFAVYLLKTDNGSYKAYGFSLLNN
jgi:uncharacterized membrane protein (DUF485 family)